MECLVTCTTISNNWRLEIRRLMEQQDARQVIRSDEARKITQYVLVGGDLYRRGFTTPLLKCLLESEVQYMLDELHTERRTLKARAISASYYWPTMEEDAKHFVQNCPACQAHANDVHAPLTVMHSMVFLCLFGQ